MQTLLNRLISVVRGCLGWHLPFADQPDGRMTPDHGWLLPIASTVAPASRTPDLRGKPTRS